MKRPLKVLAWTTGGFVVLTLLLVLGLRLFLPAEKLRDLAVTRASAALGREVTVEDVRVSLRGGLGVQLTGVGIGNPVGFPAGHLMTAKSVDLKLRLRPLFSRQLHADRLVINAPTISLVKFDATRNNYTFAKADSVPSPDGDAPAKGAATLNLERLECDGGMVSFRDEEAGTAFELTGLGLSWTVSDDGSGQLTSRGKTGADSLKVSGKQAIAVGPVTFDHLVRLDPTGKRVNLEEGTLVLAGLEFAVTAASSYDPETPVTEAQVTGEALDLAALLALVPAETASNLDGVKASGTLGLRTSLTFDRTLDDPLALAGALELTGGQLQLPDLPDPITNLSGSATFDNETLELTTVQASVSGTDLVFAGAVTGLSQPADMTAEGTLNLTANLAGLQGYLPAERQAVLGGKATGQVKLAGRVDTPRALLSGGEFTVTDLRYRDASTAEPVTDLDATVTFGPRDVTIKSCSVKLEVNSLTLSGELRGLVPALLAEGTASPKVDCSLKARFVAAPGASASASSGAAASGVDLGFNGTVAGLTQAADLKTEGTLNVTADLAGLQGYLPAERKAVLGGKATGWIKFAGRVDTPRELLSGGEFTVTDLRYRDANIFEPVTDLDATVTFGPRDVTLKSCSVKLEPSNFTLSGVVRDLVPALWGGSPTKPHLEFALNAPLFNADHLFPAASPGVAPPVGTSGAERPPVVAEFPDFTGSGTVTLANLIYGGVTFTDLTGTLAIADRTLKVGDVTGAVYAGQVTGETSVDLNDMSVPGYSGSFAATGIQADSLLSRFTPLKNHLYGALDFRGTYAASGKEAAAFRRSLTLDASSAMTQGRLVTTGVIQQGISTLAKQVGHTFEKEEKLKDLAGSVKVSAERVMLDRFASEIPGLGQLTLEGSYGFNGDLDFKGDLLLTEENSRKLLGGGESGLTGALGSLLGKKDPETVARLRLPMTIGGAFTRPEVGLDFSAVGKESGQEIVNELKGKLGGLFKK